MGSEGSGIQGFKNPGPALGSRALEFQGLGLEVSKVKAETSQETM